MSENFVVLQVNMIRISTHPVKVKACKQKEQTVVLQPQYFLHAALKLFPYPLKTML